MNRINTTIKFVIATAILICMSGCSVVELDHKLPSEFLDHTNDFVGIVTVVQKNSGGYDSSSTFRLMVPDRNGKRLVSAVHRNADPNVEEKKETMAAEIYNVEGIRYLLFLNDNGGVLARIVVKPSGTKVEFPKTKHFVEHWPKSGGVLKGSTFKVSASGDQLVNLLSDKKLSDRLFEESLTASISGGSGVIFDAGDPDQPPLALKVALSLPRQLSRSQILVGMILPAVATSVLMLFLTSRGLLNGFVFEQRTAWLDRPTIGWCIVGAAIIWTTTTAAAIVTSGNVVSSICVTTLFFATLICFGIGSLLPYAERLFWQPTLLKSKCGLYRVGARIMVRQTALVSLFVSATCVVAFSIWNLTTILLGPWAFLTVFGCASITSVFTTWLTLENSTVVSLIAKAARIDTAKRAVLPIGLAVAMVSPGFLFACWLQDRATKLIDEGLATTVDFEMPGLEGVRPIVREPRIDDGLLPFVLGVPQVEMTTWKTDSQQFSIETPVSWRTTIVFWVRAFTTFTTALLIVLLSRLVFSILLRVAATDLSEPIIYQPVTS